VARQSEFRRRRMRPGGADRCHQLCLATALAQRSPDGTASHIVRFANVGGPFRRAAPPTLYASLEWEGPFRRVPQLWDLLKALSLVEGLPCRDRLQRKSI